MKKCYLFWILIIVILYFLFFRNCKENFVDYETRRSYYYCKYGADNAACNRYQHRKNTLDNMVKLVGYVTNIKNRRKHKLYSYYNIDYNRHGYLVGITKRYHDSDELKIELSNKIRDLYNNDIINIPTMRGKYKVTLYNEQLNFSDYAGLPFEDIGYIINDKNNYHRLYRRPINRFKYQHGFYNRNNIFIPLEEQDELYNGDKVKHINNQIYTYYNNYDI